jgi:hypothetical protein
MVTTANIVPYVAFLLSASVLPNASKAAPIAIEVIVRVDTRQWTARSPVVDAQEQTRAHRPVVIAQSGAIMHVGWSIINHDEIDTFRNVTAHCTIQKDNGSDHRESSRQDPTPVYESAVLTDFAPLGRSTADFAIQAPEPGIYTLRVETIGAAKQQGRESAALLEMHVL